MKYISQRNQQGTTKLYHIATRCLHYTDTAQALDFIHSFCLITV